jgi:hypothetical protein
MRSTRRADSHRSQDVGFQISRGIRRLRSVTFVEWTQFLPADEILGFVNDVLDRYRVVAADRPGEDDCFKFYQMDVTLSPI